MSYFSTKRFSSERVTYQELTFRIFVYESVCSLLLLYKPLKCIHIHIHTHTHTHTSVIVGAGIAQCYGAGQRAG